MNPIDGKITGSFSMKHLFDNSRNGWIYHQSTSDLEELKDSKIENSKESNFALNKKPSLLVFKGLQLAGVFITKYKS